MGEVADGCSADCDDSGRDVEAESEAEEESVILWEIAFGRGVHRYPFGLFVDWFLCAERVNAFKLCVHHHSRDPIHHSSNPSDP